MDQKDKKRIAVILICSIIFIFLTFWVRANPINGFDTSVYNFLSIHMNNYLTSFFEIITYLGDKKFLGICCAICMIAALYFKDRKYIILAIILAFNRTFNNHLKDIIQRPRPELAEKMDFSFPSNHSVVTATICGILLYLLLKSDYSKNTKIIGTVVLLLLAFLVCISRVYLGEHNASDVLGGSILTVILLLIEIIIIEKMELF